MRRILLALGLSVFMVGCSQNAPVAQEKVRIDVDWPNPISELKAEWQVIDVQGQPWVGMSFEDFQTKYRPWMNDVLRYTRDINSVVCFYRAPLKEPKCFK